MIQRIQSIYLLLAAVIYGTMFILPHAVGDSLKTVDTVFISALIVFIMVVIFSFKNRKKQIRLGYFALLFSLVFFSLLAFAGNGLEDEKARAGAMLPLVAMLFIFLAIRSIKKDEELIRSSERLR
jgi:peptidoglycan/LPS O-acetylase OafA/YrhL